MTKSTTYDIIRNRLQQQAGELSNRLQQLNTARKEVFGSVESALIANDRITTGNYCTARDIVAVGEHCILGYNVHLGLRSGIQLADVFSVYRFNGKGFEEEGLSILQNEDFQTDFHNLYRYYKEAYFARFAQRGRHLYMIFHLKPGGKDFKAFKWLRTEEGLQYVDNRSDQEVRFPNQYEFRWQQAGRDEQRQGRQGVGFGAEVAARHEKDLAKLLRDVLPEDLVRYGLIPEFIGRLPIVSSVEPLDREALVDILTSPKNALTKQYRRFFEFDGVELEFDESALQAIADLAILRQTGARGLRAILEEVLLNTMYELPSREDVGRCVITDETVRNKTNPTLVPHGKLHEVEGPQERSA